uniref:cell wall integrity and stress response component 1-like n=1 Tax=Styela clava TaxID=7725 RepID=UPI00193AC761|nr:cell wall integrity and stress response component 1-like [Styela clava]
MKGTIRSPVSADGCRQSSTENCAWDFKHPVKKVNSMLRINFSTKFIPKERNLIQLGGGCCMRSDYVNFNSINDQECWVSYNSNLCLDQILRMNCQTNGWAFNKIDTRIRYHCQPTAMQFEMSYEYIDCVTGKPIKSPTTTSTSTTTTSPTTTIRRKFRLEPTAQSQTSLKPTNQLQSSLKPTDQSQTSLKPTNQLQSSLKPTDQSQTSLKPTNQLQSSLKPTDQSQTSLKPTNQSQNFLKSTNQSQNSLKPTNQSQNSLKPTDQSVNDLVSTDQSEDDPAAIPYLTIGIIVGSIVFAFILQIVVVGVYIHWKKRKLVHRQEDHGIPIQELGTPQPANASTVIYEEIGEYNPAAVTSETEYTTMNPVLRHNEGEYVACSSSSEPHYILPETLPQRRL